MENIFDLLSSPGFSCEDRVFSKMAEVRSGESESEKPPQNIELSEKDQAQKPTDEKNNASTKAKEAKTKSTLPKLGYMVYF